MFRGCTALEEIDLSRITNVATYAFVDCTSLKSVILNDNLTSIGNYTFQNCSSLATIHTGTKDAGDDAEVKYVKQSEVGHANLPSKLSNGTCIGTRAFEGTAIEVLIIPEGVTRIGSSATSATTSTYNFLNCTNLKKVILPSTLVAINAYAFDGCTSLQTLQYTTVDDEGNVITDDEGNVITNGKEGEATFSTSMELIGNYAFRGTAFTKITVPSSVQRIGSGSVFGGNTNLKEVVYLTKVIGTSSTSTNAASMFADCVNLEKVTLNDAITRINTGTFAGCTSLKTLNWVTVGSAVINGITDEAITGEEGVITLREGLTFIGDDAFSGLTAATAVTLPASLTSLGDNSFGGAELSLAQGSTAFIEQSGAVASTSTGEIVFISSEVSGDQVLPANSKLTANILSGNAKITSVTLTTDQLCEYAFTGYAGKVVVTLGESKTIPDYAFSGYLGNSITLPEGVTAIGEYAFENCTSLTGLILPESVTEIGEYAFSGAGLTSVTLPDGITSIGRYAFQNCTSLAAITIPEAVTELDDYTFDGCANLASVALPDGITLIGQYAFQNCTSLEVITLPAQLEKLGIGAFMGCTSLREVTIPSLTGIDGTVNATKSPFLNCTSLEKVTLGEGVTSLPNYLFNGSGLKEVTLSTDITYGTYMFANSPLLETVYIPEDLTALPNYIFQNCPSLNTVATYHLDEKGEMVVNEVAKGTADLSCVLTVGNYAFQNCTAITSVIFSEELTSLGNYSFSGSGLVTATVPGSVADGLGTYVFAYCPSLETVVIEEGVTKLGTGMFRESLKLSSVSIPETITSISGSTFYGCTGIAELVIPASVWPTTNNFTGWTAEQKVIIYVPALDSGFLTSSQSGLFNSDAQFEFVPVYDQAEDEEEAE